MLNTPTNILCIFLRIFLFLKLKRIKCKFKKFFEMSLLYGSCFKKKEFSIQFYIRMYTYYVYKIFYSIQIHRYYIHGHKNCIMQHTWLNITIKILKFWCFCFFCFGDGAFVLNDFSAVLYDSILYEPIL